MEREFIDIPIQEIPQATKEEAKFMGLLNDYLLKYYAEYGNRNLYCELGGWSLLNVHETVIISKKFGFIKWLVDNDKIDRDRILKENGQFRLFYYDLERVKNYDRLVMYLSVEDNSIEFLVSILK